MEDYDPTIKVDPETEGCFRKIIGLVILGFAMCLAIGMWLNYQTYMIRADLNILYILSILPMIIGLVCTIVFLYKRKKERDFIFLIAKNLLIYLVCATVYMIIVEIIWHCLTK